MNTTSSTPRLTQRDIVLQHLKNQGSITAVEAMTVHKIPRVAARIGELREKGWNIKSNVHIDAAGDRYTRYTLQKNQHPLRSAIRSGRAIFATELSFLTEGYIYSLVDAQEILASMGVQTDIIDYPNGRALVRRHR